MKKKNLFLAAALALSSAAAHADEGMWTLYPLVGCVGLKRSAQRPQSFALR